MNFESTSTGEIIRLLRKAKGMSRTELSVAAGISESHIKKIEIGIRHPGIDTYKKILGVLEADIVIMNKKETVKGNCTAKIQEIMVNSTEEQALYMTRVLECMAENMELMKTCI